MKLRKSPFVWMALALLLAIAAVWLFKTDPPNVRLADGSVVRLEQVLYQSNESGRRLLPWVENLRTLLARVLGRPSFTRRGPTNSLVLWISRRDAQSGKYWDFDWMSHAVVVDSHGCEFPLVQTMVQSENWGAGGRQLPKAPSGAKYILVSGVLPVFPRREKSFKLRLYHQQQTLVAELDVPNPAYRSYPEWTPQPLPIVQQSGTLTASLVKVTRAWTDRGRGLELGRFSLTPEFTLVDPTQPAEAWEAAELEIEDATGNRSIDNFPPGMPSALRALERRRFQQTAIRSAYASAGRNSNRPLLSTQFSLCTNEPAWKLRASFFRTARAEFHSDEVWTVPQVKIPRPGTATALNLSNSWHGASVVLCAIGGPGSITYSNGIPTIAAAYDGSSGGRSSARSSGGISISEISVSTPRPHIVVSISGLEEAARFHASAYDGVSTNECPARSSSNEYRLLELDPSDGASAVDLRFVIQRPKMMDFLIAPGSALER